MNVFEALICGIIQGLAEFLPISSSGHLALFHNIFGGANIDGDGGYLAFDLLLHLGTLAAVLIIYRKLIIKLIPAFFTMIGKVFKRRFKLKYYDPDERMCVMVLIALIPLIFVKLFKLDDLVESLGSYTWVVGLILIFNGLMLFVSDSFARGGVDIGNTKPRNALVVGFCQMVAVLPGLSRSGSTITGGLTQGFERDFAVRFSFILSIPAIVGGNIFKIKDLFDGTGASIGFVPAAVGLIASFIFGIIAMNLLIYISKKSNFRAFSYYCFAVGLFAIVYDIIK